MEPKKVHIVEPANENNGTDFINLIEFTGIIQGKKRNVNQKVSFFYVRNFLTSKGILGGLRFNKPVLNGEACQFCIIPQIKFLEQPQSVSVHGLDADVIGFSNFAIGLS